MIMGDIVRETGGAPKTNYFEISQSAWASDKTASIVVG
jgi:hypothetical protein